MNLINYYFVQEFFEQEKKEKVVRTAREDNFWYVHTKQFDVSWSVHQDRYELIDTRNRAKMVGRYESVRQVFKKIRDRTSDDEERFCEPEFEGEPAEKDELPFDTEDMIEEFTDSCDTGEEDDRR